MRMPVQVKICGITNVEDAVAAAEFGADFIGLNFYPGSSRCVTEGMARLILQALPRSVTPVALFVNEPWERVGEVAGRLGITMVQLHGDQLSPCPVDNLLWMPAFAVIDQTSLDRIHRFIMVDCFLRPISRNQLPVAVLVDAHVVGKYGGTGQTAPWDLLANFVRRPIPNLILAGGLTPHNVAEAIRIVRPWAVDVASGVESGPGKKDHDKMRRFIENAKAAG